MEKRTREELALMSKEEMEALVMHLQEEAATYKEKWETAAQHRDLFYKQANKMEERINLMQRMLASWID